MKDEESALYRERVVEILEKLGWQPTSPEEKAWYLAHTRRRIVSSEELLELIISSKGKVGRIDMSGENQNIARNKLEEIT